MEKMTLVKRTVNHDYDTMRFWFFDNEYTAMRYIFNQTNLGNVEMVAVLPDHVSFEVRYDGIDNIICWDVYAEEILNYKDVIEEDQ